MIGYRPGAVYAHTPPYEHQKAVLEELQSLPGVRLDPRLNVDPSLAWSTVWAGLVTIPMKTVRQHDLYFDENFHDWGAENIEWGYRIWRTGTPLVMREDVYGVHQPHPPERPSSTNLNYFLTKWPVIEVELWRAFDAEAAHILADVEREVASNGGAGGLGIVMGVDDAGRGTLIVGVALDEHNEPAEPEQLDLLAEGSRYESLPLVGFALPYPDQSVERCAVRKNIQSLRPDWRDAVLREARRVARSVSP